MKAQSLTPRIGYRNKSCQPHETLPGPITNYNRGLRIRSTFLTPIEEDYCQNKASPWRPERNKFASKHPKRKPIAVLGPEQRLWGETSGSNLSLARVSGPKWRPHALSRVGKPSKKISLYRRAYVRNLLLVESKEREREWKQHSQHLSVPLSIL